MEIQSKTRMTELFSNKEIRTDLTPLQEFYTGSKVFITGGTGFLGKALIEKLLRTCPEIDSIYLLVRMKKGKDIHTRIEDIFQDTVFDKVKELLPKFRNKLHIVPGDCALEDLGLNNADREELIKNVEIVFHVAATVRFDEKLRVATAINVRATREMIRLCKEMSRLKSAIHVSTAYSNCVVEGVLDEKFYTPPISGTDLQTIVDASNDQLLESITPIIQDKWPNTYAFTKAVAEDVVRSHSGDLPMGIFRPSIVTSTYREPIPGWVDNLYGPTGVVAGAGAGLFRTLRGRSGALADLIPVDLCVNGLAASAWDVARRSQERRKSIRKLIDQEEPAVINEISNKNSEDTVPIYNYTLGENNSLTWSGFMSGSLRYGQLVPTMHVIWYFCFFMIPNPTMYTLSKWLLHLLPAFVVDTSTVCLGKKPRLWDAYKKIHKMSDVLAYFTFGQWRFKKENVQSLWQRLDPRDKDLFFFDTSSIDWDEYFENYFKGIRVHVLKDPLSTLEKARIKWRRLYWLHQFTKLILFLALMRFAWFFAECLIFIFGLVGTK